MVHSHSLSLSLFLCLLIKSVLLGIRSMITLFWKNRRTKQETSLKGNALYIRGYSVIFPSHVLSFKIYLELFPGRLFVVCIQSYLVNNFVIKAWKTVTNDHCELLGLHLIISALGLVLSSWGSSCFDTGVVKAWLATRELTPSSLPHPVFLRYSCLFFQIFFCWFKICK